MYHQSFVRRPVGVVLGFQQLQIILPFLPKVAWSPLVLAHNSSTPHSTELPPTSYDLTSFDTILMPTRTLRLLRPRRLSGKTCN
jgi:hypothetical protein